MQCVRTGRLQPDMTDTRKTEEAPAEAGAARPIPSDEIRLIWNAQVYGDIEPLLQCFVEYGIKQKATREFIADLARGHRPRAERDRYLDNRNYRIRAMVANRRGLLQREGKDPRRAITMVAEELQRAGMEIDRKQIKRIWESRNASLRTPSYFGDFYHQGLEGFKVRI